MQCDSVARLLAITMLMNPSREQADDEGYVQGLARVTPLIGLLGFTAHLLAIFTGLHAGAHV